MKKRIPSRVKDLTGKIFGRLTVIEQMDERIGCRVAWKCLCDCGNTTIVSSGNLIRSTRSCGKHSYKDMTGACFSKLVVLSKADKTTPGTKVAFWNCICDCGNTCVSEGHALRRGHIVSCGCKHMSRTANLLLDRVDTYLKTPMIREYVLKDRRYDGFIEELGILIESDGAYWHNTVKGRRNDKYKNNLAKEAGLLLVRVTNNKESDIPQAMQIIMKAING